MYSILFTRKRELVLNPLSKNRRLIIKEEVTKEI